MDAMPQDDYRLVKIDQHRIGIIGLKQAIEQLAETHSEKTDNEVQVALFECLSKKNYIPEPARESYGKAFVREFRKHLGQPYDEAAIDGLEIKVLGPGCAQCDRLEREIMQVLNEINLAADLEHITDIKEIGQYGVMGTPALIINGKVKSVGKVPPKEKIKRWIEDANEPTV